MAEDKWWVNHTRVRSTSDPKQLGIILHVLPSGSALVQWDKYRDARYVSVTDLAPHSA